MRSGTFDPDRMERIREWLARYVGKQNLLGLSVNMEALKKDAPGLATPFALLDFLQEAHNRLNGAGGRGILLVLDEINGIAGTKPFAQFLKGLVDANAAGKPPVPLMLMLCGVEELRGDMIRKHEPVARVFDVVGIHPMSESEMEDFFDLAFKNVQMTVEPAAMALLTHYSAGFPKIMHILGDAAYWLDRDGIINRNDAIDAIVEGAEEVGKKFVDQQVYRALRSQDYHSILQKIAAMGSQEMRFRKKDVAAQLTEREKRKLNNFLQKMKGLQVLRSGDVQGEYVFNMRMVRLYIWLQSLDAENEA